ncbi:antA/AntB antirepressor family protein [Clostridium sp. Marseille-Q2269]|uniref:antA/AntB antirepressor family protein n=1 Tax=Clostridium sp. Marseille-Q2269 TaxID=2942205 RepID=UPI00207331AD|nr:antA/AntB antirepressor family protein [Clostridium sp. Marseille-Q2269]
MNELIKITTNENEDRLVSARELHEFLESKQDFTTWVKSRIEKYGFIENKDYTTFHKFVERERSNLGSTRTEYAITLDMAKELAMVENNKRGKQAREYFINIEKNYRKDLFKIQDNAYKKIGQLEMEVQALKDKLPKPVLIAKREINVIDLFNYINKISGDGLLFNEMYYKIDKVKGTLSIDIRKTYKVLRENYKDVEMFKSQPVAIERALEKQDFCYGAYFVTNLLNNKYEMKPTHVAIIDIKKLEDAGGCIDNLH